MIKIILPLVLIGLSACSVSDKLSVVNGLRSPNLNRQVASESIPAVFAPGKYIPLSGFQTASLPTNQIALSIPAPVMTYLAVRQAFIRIAYRAPDGTLEYLTPNFVDSNSGLVGLSTEKSGTFTAVADGFTNALPIVTHWSQSLNGGKGGPQTGATDAINTIDWDLQNNKVIHTVNHMNYDPQNPYFYDVGKYALFGDPSVSTPSHDRYVAEDFALSGISDLYAVIMSAKILMTTGFPVLYQNYPAVTLHENVPFFQVINGIKIIPTGYPTSPSLITVVLPPFWNSHPVKGYPVIFTGFYDLNDNVFLNENICSVSKILGEAYTSGRGQAIAVFWNGGGANASYTFQRSAYEGFKTIFDMTAQYLKADINNIITVGSSRGGITALNAAGNPYGANYTVKYACAHVAPYKAGDENYLMSPLTCPSLASAQSYITGYKYAWQPGWKDPQYGAGAQDLSSYIMLGLNSPSVEEANNLTAISDSFMQTMKTKGTKLFLYSGTHDSFKMFYPHIDLVRKARELGIPVEQLIAYRAGHNDTVSMFNKPREMLFAILEGREYNASGTVHQRKVSGNDWAFENFNPDHFPFFFEGPRIVMPNAVVNMSVVGEPGSDYKLTLTKILDTDWNNNKIVTTSGPELVLMQGVLSQDPEFSYTNMIITVPNTNAIQTGFYVYDLSYKLPGSSTWTKVSRNNVSLPIAAPSSILQVINDDISGISGDELNNALSAQRKLSWGLSEY